MKIPRPLGPGPIRAALVGCGNIGAVHQAALGELAGVELVALCDNDAARLAAARRSAASSARPGEGAAGFADFAELLAVTRPDSVHICTPHHLHAPMAAAALAAGARVLMEKPLAMDLAEGEALVRAWEESGLQAGLCFQNRYRPSVIAAKKLLEEGRYGRLLGIRATVAWHRDASYYASAPWRGRWATEGGGVLINQAIHTIDLVQWLGGGCLSSRAAGGNLTLGGVIEVEDSAIIAMELEGGARAMVFATNGHVEDAPVEIEIICEEARLRLVNDLVVYKRTQARAGLPPVEAPGESLARDEASPLDACRAYWGSGHAPLFRDFYACLREGRAFGLDLRAGLASLAILDRAYAQLGRPARA